MQGQQSLGRFASPNPSPTSSALPSPTPTPIAFKHVQTWDTYDGGPASMHVSPQQAAPWLTWAMTDPSRSAKTMAAGIRVALYSDPNRAGPGSPIYTDDETTFAHDCYGNRITVQGSTDLLMDVHSPHLWLLWPAEIVLFDSWKAKYDYIFEDSADEIQTQKLSAQPCNFNQDDWTAQTNTMDGLFGHPIIYNGLGLIPAASTSPGPSIGLNATTDGGMAEDCYSGRTPTGYYFSPHWDAMENTEIQMGIAHKFFVCQSNWYGEASQSVGQRMYFYASFLMTYQWWKDSVNTNFGTASALHVMPESELVALAPTKSTPTDISGLALAGGMYGREYNRCYFATKYVGPCGVLVNPNNPAGSQPLPFPWTSKYHHMMTVTGDGVLDGGKAQMFYAAPPAQVPGGTGMIVFH